MNKQLIQKLVDETGLKDILADHAKKYPELYFQEPIEEFARLMIVEIVTLMVTELDYHIYYEPNRDKVEAFVRAERVIKEHFGIEELFG